jgi:hypothetical protein
MPTYIVRVELRNYASSDQYTQLHDAMGKVGFSRTIAGPDGSKYRLPTAEYCIISAHTAKSLTDMVYSIAKQIDNDCAVLTVEATNTIWFEGLEKI